MSLVRKILVANRGQIACRIMRTAKRMGIQCVAIHSDIDKHSKFVEMADQAYRVGPNPSIESYLNSKKILQIAIESKCQALHPGFGFLSENASFAEQCDKNGVTFIGPPSSAITAMGSKSESKKIMTKANVPVVPGYHQDNQDPKILYQEAQKIGYPVLIKAVSGGGGKGMRIVRSKDQFLDSLQSCKRQSLKAFKDDRVIIEKYITKPRHIEVQIFGDKFKNYVHLYERDCSIQRRHQKVVEEAPSNISDKIRHSICESAVNAAKAVGYYNAGTVEFIFDLDSNKHYFMEMNTRLQVQHPISQMITGFDFVQWQLLVASNFPLPKKQSEIQKKGNAIEVRVYSQDPFHGFLPGNGTLKYFRQPVERGKNVRIQTGVRQKDTISTFYDPMIAKLITYGQTRTEAIEHMKRALSEYRVVGLPNNLKFLKRVIDDPIFQKGQYDTSYIEKYMDKLLKKDVAATPFQIVSAIISRNFNKNKSIKLPKDLLSFRNVHGKGQTHQISIKQSSYEKQIKIKCQINVINDHSGTALIQGRVYKYNFEHVKDNILNITVNDHLQKVEYVVEGDTIHLFDTFGNSTGFNFESDKMKEIQKTEIAEKILKSPMPGTISKIFCKVGDELKKGDPIFAMQSMKMQHTIRTSRACKIHKISVKQGQFVQSHQTIVELQN